LPLLLTITAETLAAAQWSTGLVIDSYKTFTGCSNYNFMSMNDLGMNFRVNPEIVNITDAFDYSTDPNLVIQLLASSTTGQGFANPTVMYQNYFAKTNGKTYS